MERPEPAPERRIAAEALASRGAAVADTFSLVDADATVVIATPTASIVWRILRPGSIERSSDGGSTWISQLSDQDVELTAGSAPTASVCWVVGRDGVVFRTTDGQTWGRLATPAVVDLIGIEASDASAATVTATDGTRHHRRTLARPGNGRAILANSAGKGCGIDRSRNTVVDPTGTLGTRRREHEGSAAE